MRFNVPFLGKRWAFRLALACAFSVLAARAPALDAVLQGQEHDDTSWVTGTLHDHLELDRVGCRIFFQHGPASNQVVVLQFDHSEGTLPLIQDLNTFTTSANVIITSPPTLSAPLGQDIWSYTFTVDVTDDNDGYVRFRARLSAGCHLSTLSGFKIRGSDSLGTLKIEKPGAGGGTPNLVVYTTGPDTAAPGDLLTYTLNYFNTTNAAKGSDRSQLTEILPAGVTYVPDSATDGGTLVGNVLTWDLPDHVDEGQFGSVSFQVQVNPGLGFGDLLENLAEIYSSEDDEDYSDNSDDFTTVISFNRQPTANDDNYSVNERSSLVVPAPGVLANDTDADENPLTPTLVNGTSHGTLMLNSDGSFSYVPVTTFSGQDSFTYKVNDGLTDSPIATVVINVLPVNDPPVATQDYYNGRQDTLLSVPAPGVLANDSDIDGDSLEALFVAGPEHGMVALDPDGSFMYMPATNFYGVDHFTYQATDGLLLSAVSTVTITVRRANQAPTINIISPTNGTVFFALATIPIVAEAYDEDGTVTKIEFFEGTNHLAQTNLTSPFTVWTNVPSSNYLVTAKATDNEGAIGISAPVEVIVIEHPPFITLQPVHFNPQTGLFEETVRISNPSQKRIDGVRVMISNLRTNVAVFNASGKFNGVSYVQTLLPIAAGASMDLRLEYSVPDFVTPNPSLVMEVVPPAQSFAVPVGTIVEVTRRLRLGSGDFLVEFNTLSNRVYFVQYSSDVLNWKTAWPSIKGIGSRIQWVDNGPPRTESLPPDAGGRFYRVLLAP